jgi:hypothetical protein
MNVFDSPDSFSLSCFDMFAYRDYQRDCILQKKAYNLFSVWYKEKYGIEVPIEMRNSIDKSFKPKK